ncbi:DUF6058 family natural product biosynthesis protein [Sphingomonas koreensis]
METELESSSDAYVARWFWSVDTLATAVGLEQNELLAFIDSGCTAGPVYARLTSGQWWSALAASCGEGSPVPPDGAKCWYSRSSAWDIRRAILHRRLGLSLRDAAAENERHFCRTFIRALNVVSSAEDAFPQCWADGAIDPAAATATAVEEWQSWSNGAYGVCLRIFNAQTCVAKETLAARMKRALATADPFHLLDDAEALD